MSSLIFFHQHIFLISAIDCGRLPKPQHGEKIEETSTTFDGKVVFECKKTGYELKGSAQRTCQENGRWSGNKTTCERKFFLILYCTNEKAIKII